MSKLSVVKGTNLLLNFFKLSLLAHLIQVNKVTVKLHPPRPYLVQFELLKHEFVSVAYQLNGLVQKVATGWL